jgi:death-on-curing protein
MEPVWMREDAVLAIHRRQLAEHGGLEGIRDRGLLDSALARPRNLLADSDPVPDLAALVAAYAFGLVMNHPFVDGNKRTALVVSRTFIIVNGQDLRAEQEEKYLVFLHLAQGKLSEEELASWIRERLVKPSELHR